MVVLPQLLSGLEAHLSADHAAAEAAAARAQPLRRARRHVSGAVPRGDPSGESSGGNIVLSVPAFGRTLRLNLSRSSAFLSEGFAVEERRGGERSAAPRRLSETQLCFYSGSVINHTNSLASVSTCGGLVNPFTSSGGSRGRREGGRKGGVFPFSLCLIPSS